jgi:hypothetical protein
MQGAPALSRDRAKAASPGLSFNLNHVEPGFAGQRIAGLGAWHSAVEALWGTANGPCLRHRIPKMIRSRGKNGRRTSHVFQRVIPLFLPAFSLLFALAEII